MIKKFKYQISNIKYQILILVAVFVIILAVPFQIRATTICDPLQSSSEITSCTSSRLLGHPADCLNSCESNSADACMLYAGSACYAGFGSGCSVSSTANSDLSAALCAAPAPSPSPSAASVNCDRSISCSGVCTAAVTCSASDISGTKNNCLFTSYHVPTVECNPVAAPDQPCTIPACVPPNSCNDGICNAPATSCGTGKARSTGLVSTQEVVGSFNTTGACVRDALAAFAPYKLPSYDDLKSLYFTQSKAAKTEYIPPSEKKEANQGTINSRIPDFDLLSINGNLRINGNISDTVVKPFVIFVENDLHIDNNIVANRFGPGYSGLVFVVKGNVNISSTVSEISAVIISAGTIYTAGNSCSLATNPGPNNQLVVYGSLISLSEDQPVQFCRKLTDNSQPAEKIITQPKYLIILRDLFANTLQKWSEVQ